MLINIPHNFPALDLLAQEQVDVSDFVTTDTNIKADVTIAVLNLMPLKITTEADILRVLSNSPLNIHIDFVNIETHTPKNTPVAHLQKYYHPFSAIKHKPYDGLIVTGAPVELMPFEEVNYWQELSGVFDWARTHVRSTLYICWASQAALYHFYGVPKYELSKKLFGVYKHTVNYPMHPLFRGFDDCFYVPHSRHTTLYREDIERHAKELAVLSESDQAGVYLIGAKNYREFYITGHSEYAAQALHNEYIRDMKKKLTTVGVPYNYYKDNNPNQPPKVQWRSHAHLLFTNWLHQFAVP